MYMDAFVDMAEAGKITGRNKALDRGRQTYAFGAGSQKLYDYLDDDPECMSAPVAAETAGVRHISGAGGQLDFLMGAYLSHGGKSFLCCSAAMRGKDGSLKSRIRPTLTNGAVVTDTRANVQYLVTEYGMVNLKGTSTW